MFMKNWSPRAKRKFWWLVFTFVPIIIALIGALGSWMNVPEFRRFVGLDSPKDVLTASTSAEVIRTPSSRNSGRSTDSTARKSNKGNRGTEVGDRANKSDDKKQPSETVAQNSTLPAQPKPATSNGTPFYIDSMGDSAFGIGGQFEGEYFDHPDSIEVVIPRSSLRLYSRAYHKGPRRLDYIKVGVGTFNGGEPWRSEIKSASQPVRIGRMLSPGENITLDKLRFSIPKKGLANLASHQLIIQMDNEAIITGASGNKTRSYARSQANIFSSRNK